MARSAVELRHLFPEEPSLSGGREAPVVEKRRSPVGIKYPRCPRNSLFVEVVYDGLSVRFVANDRHVRPSLVFLDEPEFGSDDRITIGYKSKIPFPVSFPRRRAFLRIRMCYVRHTRKLDRAELHGRQVVRPVEPRNQRYFCVVVSINDVDEVFHHLFMLFPRDPTERTV